MLAVFLAPFYLLFNFYIFRWLIRWMSSCTRYFQKPLLRGVVLFLCGLPGGSTPSPTCGSEAAVTSC